MQPSLQGREKGMELGRRREKLQIDLGDWIFPKPHD